MATKTLPTSTYRDVLKRSWHIIKQYKFLWIFGFFATFLGVGGELEPLFKDYASVDVTSQGIFSLQSYYQGGVITTVFENIRLFFSHYPLQAFLFILMVFVIFIIMLWLAIVSQVALFDTVNKIDKKRKVTYSEAYHEGNKHFGSVLLMNIIVKILVYALFVVIGAPLLTWFLLQSNVWGSVIFTFIIFFILIPISIILSFILKYAVAYVVIKGKNVGEAIKLGWELFKNNWLISLEMAFIILLIGICVGLVILLLIGLVSVPFLLIGISALFFQSGAGFTAAAVVGTIVWFIITALLGAIYVSYQYSAWTLLFLKLTQDKAESKILRWFKKIAPGKAN